VTLSSDRVLELLRESGALLEGHFLLSSGRRSDRYVQCALALSWPEYAGELAAGIAEKLDTEVDVVVGPAMGAVVWAQEVGRALGKRALFTERVDGEFALRRGFSVEPGQRVLVAEDVCTTGGSAKEVIALMRAMSAEVVGVASIVNRSGGNPFEDVGLELTALVDVNARTWGPDDPAPEGVEGEPVKPGSRPTPSAQGA
jgi:orotate phosphoribosyltransferase